MDNNLNLKFKTPIVASDGNTLSINENGPVNILFFQVREQLPNGINADVVAAVRLHSLQELKTLQKLIAETIKKYENREP